MTTLATIATVLTVFTWILAQEWRELTRSNRYVVKLSKARANERRAS